MPAPREWLASVDAKCLEDAVADHQPVVEHRDARIVERKERAVEPDDHGAPIVERAGSASAESRAACRSRAAFNSVSSHSASATESATMPPPTPSEVWPSAIVKVRIATENSAWERSPSTHPSAPQETPRGTGPRP